MFRCTLSVQVPISIFQGYVKSIILDGSYGCSHKKKASKGERTVSRYSSKQEVGERNGATSLEVTQSTSGHTHYSIFLSDDLVDKYEKEYYPSKDARKKEDDYKVK